jgi:hypothetical protein
VPVETLKVALPLLAKQDISVVQKMLKFLKLVRIQAAAPCTQHTNLKRSDVCAGLLCIEAAFSTLGAPCMRRSHTSMQPETVSRRQSQYCLWRQLQTAAASAAVGVVSLLQVPMSKLEQLSPLFGRITQGQVNVLMKAMSIMPEHAIDALIHMVQVRRLCQLFARVRPTGGC